MNQVEQHAQGFIKAKRVVKYLLRTYLKMSAEDDVLYWSDFGARDAYYWFCDTFRLRREA
jgi:hypothetical protein